MHIAGKASNGEAVQVDLQKATNARRLTNNKAKGVEKERKGKIEKKLGFFFSWGIVINFWARDYISALAAWLPPRMLSERIRVWQSLWPSAGLLLRLLLLGT